jgi:hypothetical protein
LKDVLFPVSLLFVEFRQLLEGCFLLSLDHLGVNPCVRTVGVREDRQGLGCCS